MEVQLITPYRVSHLQRYDVTVRGNVTSVDTPIDGTGHTCISHGHLHTATYTRGRIDIIDFPCGQHLVARNM